MLLSLVELIFPATVKFLIIPLLPLNNDAFPFVTFIFAVNFLPFPSIVQILSAKRAIGIVIGEFIPDISEFILKFLSAYITFIRAPPKNPTLDNLFRSSKFDIMNGSSSVPCPTVDAPFCFTVMSI